MRDGQKWTGLCGDEPWILEVEADRMNSVDPHCVTIGIGTNDDDIQWGYLSADEAREVAQVLIQSARDVDRRNWDQERTMKIANKEICPSCLHPYHRGSICSHRVAKSDDSYSHWTQECGCANV